MRAYLEITPQICATVVHRFLNNDKYQIVSHVIDGDFLIIEVRLLDIRRSIKCFVKAKPEVDGKFREEEFLFHTNVLGELRRGLKHFSEDFTTEALFANENLLVFQDLQQVQYRKARSFDDIHVNLALIKIAQIHAASLGFKETHGRNLNIHNSSDEDYLKSAHEGLLALVDLLPERQISSETFKRKLDKIFEALLANTSSGEEQRNVLSHGALTSKSFWFQYKNSVAVDCKMVGFQNARYLPPGYDVLHFLVHCTCYKSTMKNLQKYFFVYFEALRKEIKRYSFSPKKILTLDEFERSCNELAPFIKLRYVYHLILENTDVNTLTNVFQTDQNYREKVCKSMDLLYDIVKDSFVAIEDCYRVVQSDVEILDFHTLQFEEKCGYLGDHYNLRIKTCDYKLIHNLSFFVKTIPWSKPQRDFAIDSGATFKEHRMYSHILPMLQHSGIAIECIPKSFLSRLNDVLILEDAASKGFVKLNPQNSLDFAALSLALRALAQLHGSFLVFEEKHLQKYRLVDDYFEEFQETFFSQRPLCKQSMASSKEGLKAMVDMFYREHESKLSKDRFLELSLQGCDRLGELVQPSKVFRNTVSHGDAWVNNFMFRFHEGKPVECLLVDFQSYRYTPPAQDLMCTIYFCTDRAFREQNFEKMLDVYYQELDNVFKGHGMDVKEVVPYADFLESCEFYKEQALMDTLLRFQIVMISAETAKGLFSDPEENKRVLFEDKYEFMTLMCERDEGFRRRNLDAFLDVKEYYCQVKTEV